MLFRTSYQIRRTWWLGSCIQHIMLDEEWFVYTSPAKRNQGTIMLCWSSLYVCQLCAWLVLSATKQKPIHKLKYSWSDSSSRKEHDATHLNIIYFTAISLPFTRILAKTSEYTCPLPKLLVYHIKPTCNTPNDLPTVFRPFPFDTWRPRTVDILVPFGDRISGNTGPSPPSLLFTDRAFLLAPDCSALWPAIRAERLSIRPARVVGRRSTPERGRLSGSGWWRWDNSDVARLVRDAGDGGLDCVEAWLCSRPCAFARSSRW
jgi:hypothetical protein